MSYLVEVNMFKLVVLLSFFASSLATPVPKIVNGTNAALGEIPYIVSLRSNNAHTCGGSIITDKCVLTAAHCVYNKAINNYSIQYGVTTITSNAVNSIGIEKAIVHEKYVEGNGWINDVAVLKLKSSIPLSSAAQPVTLPSQGQEFAGWSTATLAGWGLPYTGGTVMKNLQRVDILLYPDSECESIHTNAKKLYHVCAGIPEGGKGQCSGDSGGPLTINGVQIGTVSWSVKPCTLKGYPGVFAKIANYADWIVKQCNQ